MKIWVVARSDDYGAETHVFSSKGEAYKFAYNWCRSNWGDFFPDEAMPDNWEESYDRLSDQTGMLDTLLVTEHVVNFPKGPIDQAYIQKAKIENHDPGLLEIHDDAPVLMAYGGACVQAWIWVDDTDINNNDLLKRHNYQISTAAEFVRDAPHELVLKTVASFNGLFNMVLWSKEPDAFLLTLPTRDELLEEFKSHLSE